MISRHDDDLRQARDIAFRGAIAFRESRDAIPRQAAERARLRSSKPASYFAPAAARCLGCRFPA